MKDFQSYYSHLSSTGKHVLMSLSCFLLQVARMARVGAALWEWVTTMYNFCREAITRKKQLRMISESLEEVLYSALYSDLYRHSNLYILT